MIVSFYAKAGKAQERTLKHIIPFITGKLYLKVNLEKTTVSHVSKVKYLGYGFYRNKGKCRMRVHPQVSNQNEEPSEGVDGQRE